MVLCEEIDKSFDELKSETDYLDKFYVETRYPGDIPEFTLDETQKALEAASQIKEFVLSRIKISK